MEDFLFKNNLRKCRMDLRWPQWKLALSAGIAESRICILEQGAPPRSKEKEKLSEALGVDECEIWPEDQKK